MRYLIRPKTSVIALHLVREPFFAKGKIEACSVVLIVPQTTMLST